MCLTPQHPVTDLLAELSILGKGLDDVKTIVDGVPVHERLLEPNLQGGCEGANMSWKSSGRAPQA